MGENREKKRDHNQIKPGGAAQSQIHRPKVLSTSLGELWVYDGQFWSVFEFGFLLRA